MPQDNEVGDRFVAREDGHGVGAGGHLENARTAVGHFTVQPVAGAIPRAGFEEIIIGQQKAPEAADPALRERLAAAGHQPLHGPVLRDDGQLDPAQRIADVPGPER